MPNQGSSDIRSGNNLNQSRYSVFQSEYTLSLALTVQMYAQGLHGSVRTRILEVMNANFERILILGRMPFSREGRVEILVLALFNRAFAAFLDR
uniref:Uncharacterized protein n=1 Tax=Caenorhabditis japonica TaxID=281687 RepID=A0A8R1IEF8_CAEJA